MSGRERGPGCHPERSVVILSAAKDLARRTKRPFAEFTLSEANGLRVTGSISKCLTLVNHELIDRVTFWIYNNREVNDPIL